MRLGLSPQHLVGVVAGGGAVGSDGAECGDFGFAALGGVGAAGVEVETGGWVEGGGDLALDGVEGALLRGDARHLGEQSL